MSTLQLYKIVPVSALVAALMTGCIPSVNDLQNGIPNKSHHVNIDRATDGGDYTKVQNNVYSDVALLSVPKVGLTYFHTEKRKANYPIGYGGDISFYITQTYPPSLILYNLNLI